MTGPAPPSRPIAAAGVVVWNADHVLLVRRGKPPRENEWSIPGGKVEWGETIEETAQREVREETGLSIDIDGIVGVVDSLIRDDEGHVVHHHVLIDFAAHTTETRLKPGDDVIEARWVHSSDLDKFPMWSETRRIITVSRSLLASAQRYAGGGPKRSKKRSARTTRPKAVTSTPDT